MTSRIVELDERLYVTRDDAERLDFGVRPLLITRRERITITSILFVCLAAAFAHKLLFPLALFVSLIVLIYWGLRKNADKYDCFTIDYRKGELRAGRERKPDYRDNDSQVVQLENLWQIAIVHDEKKDEWDRSGIYAEVLQGDPVRLSDMRESKFQRAAALLLGSRLNIPVVVRDEKGVTRLNQALGRRLDLPEHDPDESVEDTYRRCMNCAYTEKPVEFGTEDPYPQEAATAPMTEKAPLESRSDLSASALPGPEEQKLVDRNWWSPSYESVRHGIGIIQSSCDERDNIMVLGRNFQALQMAGVAFFTLLAVLASIAVYVHWGNYTFALLPAVFPGFLFLQAMYDLFFSKRNANVLERATGSMWSIRKRRNRLDVATKTGDFSKCCRVLRYQRQLQKGPYQVFRGLAGIFLLGWDGSVTKIPAEAGTSASTGKAISKFLGVPFEDVKSSVMMSQYVAQRAANLAEAMAAPTLDNMDNNA